MACRGLIKEEFQSFTDLGGSLKPEEIAQPNLVNIHGRITNAYCANHLDADLYLEHGDHDKQSRQKCGTDQEREPPVCSIKQGALGLDRAGP